MQLEMNFNNTLFISESQILHIYCKGKNFPLVISAYYEQYEQISKFSYAFGIVVYAVVLIIILSPKLIGV
jgi:ABC-type sulfate transport system permease subunit